MPGLDNFYLDRSRQYLIDLVEHLLTHSDSIIFIEGPPGSGKTLLLQFIEQRISSTSLQRPGISVQMVDDVDQLPEYELSRLIESKNMACLLLTGLPGSCEEIRQSGHFAQHAVERLTIPPFSADDAEKFLTEFCPSVAPKTRQSLIEQCRLYPGELRQASYDTELAQGKFPSGKLLRRAIYLATLVATALVLLRVSVQLIHENTAAEPDINPAEQMSAPVKRVISPPPGHSSSPVLEAPAEMTKPSVTNTRKSTQPQPVEQPASPVLNPITTELKSLKIDRERLLAVNPAHYTLQLMLASELRNIDQLVAHLGPTQPAFRYTKLVNQQTLYCLVYGNFSTYELAGEAINRLPADFKQLGPWRRQFEAIQKELLTDGAPE